MWPPTPQALAPPMVPSMKFQELMASLLAPGVSQLPFAIAPLASLARPIPVAHSVAPPVQPASTATMRPAVLPPMACVQPPTSSAASSVAPAFRVGEEVAIIGLSKAPAFNGKCGVVQSFDQVTGRYNILLKSEGATPQLAKVKGDHLQRPFFSPSIAAPKSAEDDFNMHLILQDMQLCARTPLRLTALV